MTQPTDQLPSFVGFSNKVDVIKLVIMLLNYSDQCRVFRLKLILSDFTQQATRSVCFYWVRSLNDHEWHVPPEHRRRDVCREVRGSMKMPLNRSDSDGEEKKTSGQQRSECVGGAVWVKHHGEFGISGDNLPHHANYSN